MQHIVAIVGALFLSSASLALAVAPAQALQTAANPAAVVQS